MSGAGLGSKLLGVLKRKLRGESLFWTYFRADGPGEVSLAGDYPGRVQAFDLGAGQSVIVQRDSFLCAQDTVQVGIEFVKRIGAGFFVGEAFILGATHRRLRQRGLTAVYFFTLLRSA